MKKKVGFIGLGRMGQRMVLRLLENNFKVVVYNRHRDPIEKIAKKGAIPSYSIEELTKKLEKPRVIWVMIKAGRPVDEVIERLLPNLSKGDIVIDGGNSYYKDSIRRYKKLKVKGIDFIDCGVSGGLEGARHGASLMIGGNKQAFKKIEPLFKALATRNGYAYVGKAGAGHFVKAIHNTIEYGFLASIGEGMEVIKKNEKRFSFNLKEIAKVYAHGSIIEGKLTGLLYKAYKKGLIDSIKGIVPYGETEDEMKRLVKKFKMSMLKEAIKIRQKTRKKPNYSGKIIAALRNMFGGHKVKK